MRAGWVVVAGAVAALALALWSLGSGPLSVSPGALLTALFGEGERAAELALALRGPRVLTAALTGAGLAGAGAALQIVFRNPLAAPDLLGVSSGAGFGASTAILLGAAPALIQLGAFAGGLAAAGLTVGCAALAGARDRRLSLVLCGIVVGALATAGLGVMLLLADPYRQLPALTFWLLGSFGRADGTEAGMAAVITVFGLFGLVLLARRLDALSLGRDQARSLGVGAASGLIAITAATLAAASAVAVAGIVGWIGLLAPHAARRLVGEAAQALIPASVLLGVVLALAIDLLSRAFGPVEIPVGLLSAALGAPTFLILFIALERRAR